MAVLAYHAIWSAYGFWLPNDPRGSWSKEVWAKNLIPFGQPKPANTRRSLAAAPHDRALRLAAKEALSRPPVRFNDAQIRCIGHAVGDEVRKMSLPVYAAAIMPDHVHLVLGRSDHDVEWWIGYFKRAAARALRAQGLHPFAHGAKPDDRVPTVWVAGGWKVFLNTPDEVMSRIVYVKKNPLAAGWPAQVWDWITQYMT